MTSLEVDGAGTSSARMRRERRLRSWLRHERMTVAMELAAAPYHSSPKGVWPETTHNAPRGQRAATSAGAHPCVVKEPEVQLEAAKVGYVATKTPLLAVSSLRGADGVDDTAVRTLLKLALQKKKEEEERKKAEKERKERMMQEIHRKVHADQPVSDVEWAAWKTWRGIGSSSSGGQKRKRKKRRKKRLPRGALLRRFPRARAVRSWKSGHIPAPCLLQSLRCQRCTGMMGYFWEMTSWFKMSMYSALCLVRLWIHAHASVHETFGSFLRWYFYGPLYLAVTCSIWFLPEEYVVPGDDVRIRRIQRFLVRQWMHIYASLRSLRLLFPYTAKCLVLSGTCYASVTEYVSWWSMHMLCRSCSCPLLSTTHGQTRSVSSQRSWLSGLDLGSRRRSQRVALSVKIKMCISSYPLRL